MLTIPADLVLELYTVCFIFVVHMHHVTLIKYDRPIMALMYYLIDLFLVFYMCKLLYFSVENG